MKSERQSRFIRRANHPDWLAGANIAIVDLMEEQHNSPLRLSDEQAAEVRRRLADPDPKTMTLAEFNERLKRRYGV